MGGELAPGSVGVVGVQTGCPGHHQPQARRLGENHIQHKHKRSFAVPVHTYTANEYVMIQHNDRVNFMKSLHLSI